jgi:hypothetical protein
MVSDVANVCKKNLQSKQHNLICSVTIIGIYFVVNMHTGFALEDWK